MGFMRSLIRLPKFWYYIFYFSKERRNNNASPKTNSQCKDSAICNHGCAILLKRAESPKSNSVVQRTTNEIKSGNCPERGKEN